MLQEMLLPDYRVLRPRPASLVKLTPQVLQLGLPDPYRSHRLRQLCLRQGSQVFLGGFRGALQGDPVRVHHLHNW